MASSVERRFTAVPVEVRGSASRTIGGYAAKFNTYSRNLGGFVETINSSAFNKSRGDGWPDVMARYNHDDNMLLGTTGGQTLRLSVDDIGLVYEVDMPQSRADIVELVERGDVRKSSFAFRTAPDGDDWTVTDQGFPLRSLLSVQLVDVAPVNSPAYLDTSTGLRGDGLTEALRSLASKFDAPLEEVRRMAEDNDLRRFFVRTDSKGEPQKRSKSGAQALVELMGKKRPAA